VTANGHESVHTLKRRLTLTSSSAYTFLTVVSGSYVVQQAAIPIDMVTSATTSDV
jgi:hypothetical protein